MVLTGAEVEGGVESGLRNSPYVNNYPAKMVDTIS